MRQDSKKIFVCFIVLVALIDINISLAEDRTADFNKIMNERASFVMSQISVPDFPENNLFRPGITVNETILADPAKATQKNRVLSAPYGYATNEAGIGGSFGFGVRYLITTEKKSFWGLRKTKEVLNKGGLSVNIYNTTSPKAAFEFLVGVAVYSSMPDSAIVWQFAESSKLEGIGTVGYLSNNTIRFIRDNIAVIIRADGEFAGQAGDIARKVDQRLLKQPLLTYDELLERCPKVTLSHKRYKIVLPKGRTATSRPDEIDCNVIVPEGRKFSVQYSTVNGDGVTFKYGKKAYYEDRREDKNKPLRVEMTVISDELLVTRIIRDIEITVHTVEQKINNP